MSGPSALPDAFRGEVWDVDFPDFGVHPAVVLSVDPVTRRLGHVAVIPITGTRGPALTHIAVTAASGLTRYDESSADVTALQPVGGTGLLGLRGRLAPSELGRIETQLRVYLGR